MLFQKCIPAQAGGREKKKIKDKRKEKKKACTPVYLQVEMRVCLYFAYNVPYERWRNVVDVGTNQWTLNSHSTKGSQVV